MIIYEIVHFPIELLSLKRYACIGTIRFVGPFILALSMAVKKYAEHINLVDACL